MALFFHPGVANHDRAHPAFHSAQLVEEEAVDASFSLACLSVLILAISFREPIRPGLLLPGIFLGFFTLLYMAKKILEPSEKR